MPDKPTGPDANKQGGNSQGGDKAAGPVTLEQIAKQVAVSVAAEVGKQVQGIRQLVNQRDEAIRDTLESLARRGGRKADPEDDGEDEDFDEEFDSLASAGRKKRHPLLRHVERVSREARERDDRILQGQGLTTFLVEADPGDPEKGILPENRKKYLPKIEEILQDRAQAGRFVHREADGSPNYKLTLENVYNHLKLNELTEVQRKSAEERVKSDKERRRAEGAAFVSGDGATGDEVPVDTTSKTSDEMLADGDVAFDSTNPPQPLYPKE